MASDDVVIDAEGRYTSGRGFGQLADEHASYLTRLRGHLGEESPVPYEEVSGPYAELMAAWLETSGQAAERLGFTGAAQVMMADGNVATERANEQVSAW
ncbi:hypothetical protein Misp01_47300 [Microtetraspora sp. NBRC 13810]|uniref:hypothetical protein n=1 Tax=Microtetraspora sp. NBRC 13810 TaxID=3030990 RepID=UPI0024A10794|nr:hypothetical protein [Microtetraspora sp. NBRC 13810]GLW09601.1 hypothetical protein Misp01_47300 [Microtetraspora sp. NBRC 13810]